MDYLAGNVQLVIAIFGIYNNMKLHININKGNKNFIKEDEGGLFNSMIGYFKFKGPFRCIQYLCG